MIEVWHLKQDVTREQRLSVTFSLDQVAQPAAAKTLFAAGLYEKVAIIQTDDLEVAWYLTNNVHNSWSREPDPRVTLTAPLHVVNGQTYGRKSSEVGDIFVQDGVLHVVANFGFTAL